MTVTVTSRVTLPALLVAVSLYVRVVAGVTARVPLTGTVVTVLVVRSVTVAEVAPVVAQESVEFEPAQIGEAEAAKLVMVGA